MKPISLLNQKTSQTVMLWLVLMLVPCCAFEISRDLPDQKGMLSTLKKAAGTDWKVSTNSGGYILTSTNVLNLQPDVSPSSKMDSNQRMAWARRTRVIVKILFTPPGIMHQFVSRHPGDNVLPIIEAEKRQHYFPCSQSGDGNAYYECPVRDGPAYAVFFFSNISPYESIHPEDQSDKYNATLRNLGLVFGLNPNRLIED